MANRHTLHKKHLNDFKEWLITDGWEILDCMSIYERLRARKGKRVLVAYEKDAAKEHLSIADRDYPVVGAFLRSRRKDQS